MKEECQIPEGFERYEVVLEGGESDSGKTYYVAAPNRKVVHAWAAKQQEAQGFLHVGVSNASELQRRIEEGDGKYQFSWPSNSVTVEGTLESPLEVIHVVTEETVAEFFDPNAAANRHKEEREKRAAQRRAMATGLKSE